jgi:23S rRNA U2552 (ribose-2'-O)-methylase RlmE/FtsJ
MIYFLLPKNNNKTYTHLYFIDTDIVPEPYISSSLSYYLYEIKGKIKIYEKEWDIYKKYTNPYEYIHTVVPNKKKCISKHIPLSRSYFKMIEILNFFKLIDNTLNIYTNKNTHINSFHLAEGPGGFVEALVGIRRNKDDKYVAMTLLNEENNSNVPGWKKSHNFLRNNENVIIENGCDGTGNILNIDNFRYCKEKYGSSMNIITGDGGFDFSMDFNNQENNIIRLLYAQVSFALCMQKRGGHFILKIFDSFLLHTIDLLYLLSSFYEKVYITKPQTSRLANSEKYVVCKNFLFSNSDLFFPYLESVFSRLVASDKYVDRLLNIPINHYFSSKIEEYNSIFGQQQIENIYYTLSLIDTKNKQDKIDNLIKNNIFKGTNWCVKNGVLYNSIYNNTNVFINNHQEG